MESENIVLGKINKKKVYLNDGKYGHYLTYESKNYKVPEWFPVDKIDIDIAERLIEYKRKCLNFGYLIQRNQLKQLKKMIQKVMKKKHLKPARKSKFNSTFSIYIYARCNE